MFFDFILLSGNLHCISQDTVFHNSRGKKPDQVEKKEKSLLFSCHYFQNKRKILLSFETCLSVIENE